MATLSKERRDWIQTIFEDDAPELIREIENLPTQDEANKMVTRLKDKLNADFKGSGLSTTDHPGRFYFGTAFKGQRPTPTLADLQQKAKALSARIRQQKDVQEAAEADALIDLMTLADNLDLNQAAVIELVRQYSLIEVMTILRTLSTVKSTGRGFKSVFFGVTTDSPDISDVSMALKQTSGRDPFFS